MKLIIREVQIFTLFLGIAFKKLGIYEEAIRNFTSAININPSDAISYNNRGQQYVIILI